MIFGLATAAALMGLLEKAIFTKYVTNVLSSSSSVAPLVLDCLTVKLFQNFVQPSDCRRGGD